MVQDTFDTYTVYSGLNWVGSCTWWLGLGWILTMPISASPRAHIRATLGLYFRQLSDDSQLPRLGHRQFGMTTEDWMRCRLTHVEHRFVRRRARGHLLLLLLGLRGLRRSQHEVSRHEHAVVQRCYNKQHTHEVLSGRAAV